MKKRQTLNGKLPSCRPEGGDYTWNSLNIKNKTKNKQAKKQTIELSTLSKLHRVLKNTRAVKIRT